MKRKKKVIIDVIVVWVFFLTLQIESLNLYVF